MKKLVLLTVIIAMLISMAGCGCSHQWNDATCQAPRTCSLCGKTEGDAGEHVPGSEAITAVDTKNLTVTYGISCSICGSELETTESATGIAPAGSVIRISPEEWHSCLVTNLQMYGAGQTLYSYPVEAQDNTLLHSIVSVSQMNVVFSYQDAEGNPLTTDSKEARDMIHNIRMDAQFTNDNAKEFFMLLMLVLINNNAALAPADANTLCAQIMSGNSVSDNGFTYIMEITSVENHTVCVSITAE